MDLKVNRVTAISKLAGTIRDNFLTVSVGTIAGLKPHWVMANYSWFYFVYLLTEVSSELSLKPVANNCVTNFVVIQRNPDEREGRGGGSVRIALCLSNGSAVVVDGFYSDCLCVDFN